MATREDLSLPSLIHRDLKYKGSCLLWSGFTDPSHLGCHLATILCPEKASAGLTIAPVLEDGKLVVASRSQSNLYTQSMRKWPSLRYLFRAERSSLPDNLPQPGPPFKSVLSS